MALKMRLIHGDVLDAARRLVAINVNDLVNQIGSSGAGTIQQISLISGTITNSYAIGSGGGSSVDYKDGRVYASGAEGALAINVTPGAALGESVNGQTVQANRLIWLAQ